MPIYAFICEKCVHEFEELCSFDECANVICPKCQDKVRQMVTCPGSVIFTNPKGTSREDNFEYVAKYNYERAQAERRAAETANQHGEWYNEIDDMPQYEGKIV